MTSTQVVETPVTTNNSPSEEYTNPYDQPTINTDSPDPGSGFSLYYDNHFIQKAFNCTKVRTCGL